ncbi:DUF2577 family protein [Lysinibacillus antri]|uniref:DUF2577 domain-containing protein n=1 Tax=Lysinibacillus antri TaxID=2498145 RepID=A0A432LAK5_9BACI|nr:DUF2577 family protein [Lysinibacillus antri]RUL51100.1 hypothetical protein EK386_12895 [Lysinibacillus antri]
MAFKPEFPTEGSPISKLFGLMGYVGYNPGGNIVRATVVKEPPNLAVRVDGETIDTSIDGLVCNPELLPHSEIVTINDERVAIEYDNKLNVGTKVYAFEPEHRQLLYILTLAE